MTNEELVQAIQDGEQDRLPELWEQVQGLAKYWASRYTRAVVASGRDTNSRELFDDLFQCGYIAMVAAVGSFDSAAGAFSTWYAYYFRQEVYSLMGWRSRPDPKTGEYTTIRRDALSHAGSLNTPLGDEEDGVCLGDMVPDPDSLRGFEEAEERIWHEQLRTRLNAALDLLPPEQASTLRSRFFRGKTFDALADEKGVKREVVRNWECKGLRALRMSRDKKELRKFLHPDDIYSAGLRSTGLSAFLHSGTSSTERAALLLAGEKA